MLSRYLHRCIRGSRLGISSKGLRCHSSSDRSQGRKPSKRTLNYTQRSSRSRKGGTYSIQGYIRTGRRTDCMMSCLSRRYMLKRRANRLGESTCWTYLRSRKTLTSIACSWSIKYYQLLGKSSKQARKECRRSRSGCMRPSR